MILVTPAPLQRRDLPELARAVLDQHWAVASLAPDRRAALLDEAAHADPSFGAALPDPDAEQLYLVATAYELAALGSWAHAGGAVPADRLPGKPDAQDAPDADALAAEVLAQGAARAFAMHRALRLPAHDGESLGRAIARLAALAVAGRRSDEFGRWLAEPDAQAGVQQLEVMAATGAWDAAMRASLWLAWIALLSRPTPQGVDDVVERLGALRERRTTEEEPFLATFQGIARMRVQFQLLTLRNVAEAAEALTGMLRRPTQLSAAPRLQLHFSVARSAAVGDHGLDLVLAWVHVAALMTAQGATDQLALPGL